MKLNDWFRRFHLEKVRLNLAVVGPFRSSARFERVLS